MLIASGTGGLDLNYFNILRAPALGSVSKRAQVAAVCACVRIGRRARSWDISTEGQGRKGEYHEATDLNDTSMMVVGAVSCNKTQARIKKIKAEHRASGEIEDRRSRDQSNNNN